MNNRNSTLVGLVLAIAVCVGCGTRKNPAVCCVSIADCNELGADEVLNCEEGLVCIDNACVAPVCQLDVDCNADAPFCADGACVECRTNSDCPADQPICDGALHSCRACSADADCTTDACDFESGKCIPEDSVLYASPTGASSADCSRQTPCSITKAVSAVSVGRFTVKLAAGVYSDGIVLDRKISIHGDGATILTDTATGMRVVDSAVARVYGLSIVKNQGTGSVDTSLGIYCLSQDNVNTPQLFLNGVVVDAQTTTRPMHINLCKLTAVRTTLRAPRVLVEEYLFLAANGGTAAFDRSTFIGGGGIAVFEANITITNSVIDEVLGKSTEGALLAAFGSISISYSTIFNSPLPCVGNVPACASAARDGVCIENSIVNKPSSLADTIAGDRCRCDYCHVSPQQGPVTGANNIIGGGPDFVGPTMGNFHLRAGSPAIDAAHPSIPGTADFDGVPRPQNGRSDLGAFEFKP